MADLFLKILNMSISASWLVLAVLVLRLALKRAPRWVNVTLWGIVAVRLICPFTIESVLSLIPSAETISPEIMMDRTPAIDSGVESIDRVVNPIITESFAPSEFASANPLQIWIPILACIWLAGMAVMLLYTGISYHRLTRQVDTAVLLRDNIWRSEFVLSPFILGVIRPRIYLPTNLTEGDLHHVVAHECSHIRRRDHWWKPLGFLLLTIHWFNPLMWVAYLLLCRDIELACDEKVIKELGIDQRADYSEALLLCSVHRRSVAACPLAFGEVGVKDRVRNVLNYRKPAFWVIFLAVVLCIAVAVCFLTDPVPMNTPAVIFEDLDYSDVRWAQLTYWGTETEHQTLTGDQTALLVQLLRSLEEEEFEETAHAGSGYRSGAISLLVYRDEQEILLHYDGDRVYFTFDSDTGAWMGDREWSVREPSLNEFFDSFGYSAELLWQNAVYYSTNGYTFRLAEARVCENAVWAVAEVTAPDGVDVDFLTADDPVMNCDGQMGYEGRWGTTTDTGSNTIRCEFLFSVDVISSGLVDLSFDLVNQITEEVVVQDITFTWMPDAIGPRAIYTASGEDWGINLNISAIYLEVSAMCTDHGSLAELADDIVFIMDDGSRITVDGVTGSSSLAEIHLWLEYFQIPDISQIREVYVGNIQLTKE